MTEVKYWLRDRDFLKLNQLGETPVLKNFETKEIICDSFLICNYIDELENKENESDYFNFLGKGLREEYEIQRLHMLFDKNFYNEVSKYFIEEIFLSTIKGNREPNADKLKVVSFNLERYINYIEYLLGKRKWLAGEMFTIADITASTQLSLLDYMGYVNWNSHQKLKDWYITIKSKKGFRNILYDRIPGFKPVKYYSELDF